MYKMKVTQKQQRRQIGFLIHLLPHWLSWQHSVHSRFASSVEAKMVVILINMQPSIDKIGCSLQIDPTCIIIIWFMSIPGAAAGATGGTAAATGGAPY